MTLPPDTKCEPSPSGSHLERRSDGASERWLFEKKSSRTICSPRRRGGGRWIRTTEGIASRFTVCPLWPLGNSPILSIQVGGAGRRIRTPDLLITNQLLYRLSYTGVLNRTRLLYYGFRNCQALFSRISFSLGTEREQPRKGEARRKSRCLSPWDSF